jgi:hypothetical protein
VRLENKIRQAGNETVAQNAGIHVSLGTPLKLINRIGLLRLKSRLSLVILLALLAEDGLPLRVERYI